ncbi:MAG: SGNH/GDSL hydrolase family protein, partial [Firmicutes bacterium]|nr:SGNH/GDSL hydrolase family protein [Bacillota bacterium]
ENLKNELNSQVDEHNELLKKLCAKQGVSYVDFNGWQKEVIKSRGFESDYFMTKDTNDVRLDVFTTTFLGLSTMISNRRKLTVTVDGVHLNKQGAKGLAALIDKTKAGS